MPLYDFSLKANIDKVFTKLEAKHGAKMDHVCALPNYTLVKPIRVVNLVTTETLLDNKVNAVAQPDVCPPDAADVSSEAPTPNP